MSNQHTLNVLFTIDTELWPHSPSWREDRLCDDYARDIQGTTASGDFGIGYQLDTFREHGLKAVFFVESLFASVTGIEHLQQTCRQIIEAGQEVQLHLHPEWVEHGSAPEIAGKGKFLWQFPREEQEVLLRVALENLGRCGVTSPNAFRAGNYGADNDTIRALHDLGIVFDSSYNYPFLGTQCGIETEKWLLQPEDLFGVREVPISFFSDYPGHYRHMQLCACSAAEMEGLLMEAWRRGCHCIVIVSHSFELIRRNRRPAVPNPLVIDRFQKLCRFLTAHGDKFRTVHFSELPERLPTDLGAGIAEPLKSTLGSTAVRLLQQSLNRLK
ncbi:polysaccharide deacetylase family protein [Geomesophilobacter sediminis]|uniref:Polysaccharide deacetylase n=1 Tax=Geomesophilobacter sediminis TaxID=2798584 RepID=A0A8J7JK90_9BACT|nr:hypothetical protein [Geomesophilobacter sediminis]MBJ6723680.1 hypothetical protein [Geomesophilobacter sediminis]